MEARRLVRSSVKAGVVIGLSSMAFYGCGKGSIESKRESALPVGPSSLKPEHHEPRAAFQTTYSDGIRVDQVRQKDGYLYAERVFLCDEHTLVEETSKLTRLPPNYEGITAVRHAVDSPYCADEKITPQDFKKLPPPTFKNPILPHEIAFQ